MGEACARHPGRLEVASMFPRHASGRRLEVAPVVLRSVDQG
jgi:hypothetical protein